MTSRLSRPVGMAAACLLLLGCSNPGPDLVVQSSEQEVGWWTIVSIDTEGRTKPADEPVPDETLIIPADVLFESGSSRIAAGQRSVLGDLATHLIDRDESVTIVGHTDDVGTTEDNQLLGQARAEAVRDLFVELGVPPQLVMEVHSAGEKCPVTDESTPRGRAQNRRVELIVSDSWTGCEEHP